MSIPVYKRLKKSIVVESADNSGHHPLTLPRWYQRTKIVLDKILDVAYTSLIITKVKRHVN